MGDRELQPIEKANQKGCKYQAQIWKVSNCFSENCESSTLIAVWCLKTVEFNTVLTLKLPAICILVFNYLGISSKVLFLYELLWAIASYLAHWFTFNYSPGHHWRVMCLGLWARLCSRASDFAEFAREPLSGQPNIVALLRNNSVTHAFCPPQWTDWDEAATVRFFDEGRGRGPD